MLSQIWYMLAGVVYVSVLLWWTRFANEVLGDIGLNAWRGCFAGKRDDDGDLQDEAWGRLYHLLADKT